MPERIPLSAVPGRLRELFRSLLKGESRRASFGRYLAGDGIEIGALHRPLPIGGLPITRIRYVDRLSGAELRRHYPELGRENLVPVDVIDDGERLSAFADGSLDFIIANHFIEHARDPIGTIRNWLAKLRPGGIIYVAVPDMRRTFDSERPLTPVEHLLEDDLAPETERQAMDFPHYLEYARFVDKKAEGAIEAHARRLSETGYSIHFHTFVPRTFRELLERARDELRLPFEIRDSADTPAKGMEFLFILSKTADGASRGSGPPGRGPDAAEGPSGMR